MVGTTATIYIYTMFMKNTACFILLFILLKTVAQSQTVFNNYIDGQIYFKIKDKVPCRFDESSPHVQITEDMPFLTAFTKKYKVDKVEASFYFSKEEILKRTFRLYFKNKEMVEDFINDLESLDEMDYAEKVPLHNTSFIPNDLGANSIAGQYGLYAIHAQEAWDLIRNINTVKIAIVDNAIETTHSDLSGILFSSRDVADMDNNANPPNNTAGWDHGTHCSGIACAQTDNGSGIASIAYGSRLMAIKTTPDTGNANFTYYGYEGIAWASSNGANIISCSFGSKNSYSITAQNVINAAYNQNAVIVASAGNNNDDTLAYPAAYANVLCVANTDIDDEKNFSSSFGNWVDVAAPGTDIRSCLLGNTFGPLTGTSMAAPLVAGLCALIKSINPAYTNTQIVNCVKNNTENIDALNPGFAGLLGTGRIDAFRSVKCALTCIGSTNYGTALMGVAKPVSSGTITSANNIISGGDVTFDAAVEIILLPDFIANNGCIFNARIDGCSNPPLFSNEDRSPIELSNTSTVNQRFMIYPNPAGDIIHFKIPQSDGKTIFNIYNSTMQLMKTLTVESGSEFTISTSDLASGIYFMDVQTTDQTFQTKFVVSR